MQSTAATFSSASGVVAQLANSSKYFLLALVSFLIGCGEAGGGGDAMHAQSYEQLVEVSMAELRLKTEAALGVGVDGFDRWDLDQAEGDIVFSNADGYSATAKAQIIGSFNAVDGSWLWAWDNPSIEPDLTLDAQRVRAYGRQHGLPKLTDAKWFGTEEDAWEMAAIAAYLCEAQGAYRGPAGTTFVFITYDELTFSHGGGG